MFPSPWPLKEVRLLSTFQLNSWLPCSLSRLMFAGCHNRVHSAFPNSQLYYTDRSPIDPFFYPMHAGTDYFFAQWQNLHSDASGMDMNRRFLGRTIGELFAYSDGPRCYRYQGVSAPSNPPASSTTTTRGSSTSASATPTGTATTAGPKPTDSPSDGRNAGNATDSAGWIPPFEKIPTSGLRPCPACLRKTRLTGSTVSLPRPLSF
ncbi:hypothetical protein BCR44DRAFT_1173703 [Catenaria anguillulae PL171]|uniref:Tyrosinase copper-binding domain-containing protein n=1 Tax=Catenaria anguillulae PL171 TaxID=765915 RepID=A0A1Y2I4M2_9FUNG|nr:hypothetical protein BCR44DRAFT_1173703 [Catenaria anguillulae PL171]